MTLLRSFRRNRSTAVCLLLLVLGSEARAMRLADSVTAIVGATLIDTLVASDGGMHLMLLTVTVHGGKPAL